MNNKVAVIIGAGPAGLTAGLELLENSDVKPIIFEAECQVGGISKTVVHNGNRMDIGGHRFFSKSTRVMKWWLNILPLASSSDGVSYVKNFVTRDAIEAKKLLAEHHNCGEVMLLRNRLSRIFFGSKFYSYPISLSFQTISNLGIIRLVRIATSYIYARVCPPRSTASLEDFFISRFGRVLYGLFFRDYTEKVWGIPCREIKSDWGAQRIKGLSITKVVIHAVSSLFQRQNRTKVETSLIDKFMYPKYGPGQLWEEVEKQIIAKGGEIRKRQAVDGVFLHHGRVTGVSISNLEDSSKYNQELDYLFSSMAIKDLVGCMNEVPSEIADIAKHLSYRDFITVGLLVKEGSLKVTLPDNWLYIQESYVKLGRIQVFNNWSPFLVADQSSTWLGLEYFASVGDELWSRSDSEMAELAIAELISLGFISEGAIIDSKVLRVEKAYPMYSGTYDKFDRIKGFLDDIPNIFPIGRNGMHRYNNQDHSMLSAIQSVECVIHSEDDSAEGCVGGCVGNCAGDCARTTKKDKTAIWNINTEQDYHEETKLESSSS